MTTDNTDSNGTPTDSEKLQRFVPGEQLPDLWMIFDARGEHHAHISNKSIVVKKDSEHYENIMRFISPMGKTQNMTYNTMVANVNEQHLSLRMRDIM